MKENAEWNHDILIVGTGCAGLFCALHLPPDKRIQLITKAKVEDSDSFLAQGGICVLKDPSDFDSFFEDTLKAGHYENDPKAVEFMIRESPRIIEELVEYGVEFRKTDGEFAYTREGAHSKARILYHDDLTGKEITSTLLSRVRERKNISLLEETELVDIIVGPSEEGNSGVCCGAVVRDHNGDIRVVKTNYLVLATGGIGGLFPCSTNVPTLTGDAVAIALRHNIQVKNADYIQIHPTALFTGRPGRMFLISESVRGEGGILLDKSGERFVDELLPRDLLTEAIDRQMKREGTRHVWLSVAHLGADYIRQRFPNICRQCLEEGWDLTQEPIPVTPAQHYFMGGIDVDLYGKTRMDRLYAIGETSHTGVHGHNRLASNSLLECLVYGKSSAQQIGEVYTALDVKFPGVDLDKYSDMFGWKMENQRILREEIERSKSIGRFDIKKTACG